MPTTRTPRVLLVSIVPPHNDCGVRIVMYRHLVERAPFVLHVATSNESIPNSFPWTPIRLPYLLHRLRRTRFGPAIAPWITEYENRVAPIMGYAELDECIRSFKPDVILTLAETGLCHVALKAARRHGIPLAALFLDWFPIMEPHFGHTWSQKYLSERYRRLYRDCDLAFCTSEGMRSVLGPHPNSHVIYPLPGQQQMATREDPPRSGRFRLVYVGSVERFYGRMISALLRVFETEPGMEFIVVGPNADWPADILQMAQRRGVYLGFRPPDKAAEVLNSADALLVVMSFEHEHELFMRTSFTTKFLDYSAFGKPIVLWGPAYSTAAEVARRYNGALIIDDADPRRVLDGLRSLRDDPALQSQLSQAAGVLRETLFNPDRLQNIFVEQIQQLAFP